MTRSGGAEPSPVAAPGSWRAEKLPARVSIREVGPRDGFQNEPEIDRDRDKVG